MQQAQKPSGVGVFRVVKAYPSFAIRLYSLIRFRIIRERFLEELGQYMPASGNVLEIGCGFGLFSLYFGLARPGLKILGVDLNEGRIAAAQDAKSRLDVDNVEFKVDDARDIDLVDGLDVIYMLDILHHIPPDSARALLRQCYDHLDAGGLLIVKDVDTRPRYKMAFTWLLDVLMTKGEFPDYWSHDDMMGALEECGFQVHRHALVDVLPYPHQLYICRKTED